jgi:GTPase SAR1 family protein
MIYCNKIDRFAVHFSLPPACISLMSEYFTHSSCSKLLLFGSSATGKSLLIQRLLNFSSSQLNSAVNQTPRHPSAAPADNSLSVNTNASSSSTPSSNSSSSSNTNFPYVPSFGVSTTQLSYISPVSSSLIALELVEFAGSNRFHPFHLLHYSSSSSSLSSSISCLFLLFSHVSFSSLQDCQYYYQEFRREYPNTNAFHQQFNVFLLGSHMDEEGIQVTQEEAKKQAESWGAEYWNITWEFHKQNTNKGNKQENNYLQTNNMKINNHNEKIRELWNEEQIFIEKLLNRIESLNLEKSKLPV